MELSEGLHLGRVRCATAHDAAEADPAGNAPTWDGVLVVAVALPWPRDVALAEPFCSLMDTPGGTMTGHDGRVWRPQAVVADGPGTRMIAFERPADEAAAGPFARREWLVPDDDPSRVVALASALLAADEKAIAEFAEHRDDPAVETVDLLVCTHGSRDVCCGGPGMSLYQQLGQAGVPDGVRVWRTSHTGGHRFAPTALSFPDGHAWAHLDASLAGQIASRSGDVADAGRHLRGSLAMQGAPAQVADREAFIRHGWDWLSVERHAVVVEHVRETLATTLEVIGTVSGVAGGASGPADTPLSTSSTRVRVELDRHIAKPTCGVVDEPEFATEPVWRVAQ